MPSTSDPRAIRIAVLCYRLTLWLYPRVFRQAFGGEMVQLFHEWSRAAYRNHGAWGLSRVWMRTVIDLMVTIPRQHYVAFLERRASLLPTTATLRGGTTMMHSAPSRHVWFRSALSRSAPVIVGLLIQWSMWVIPSQSREWLGLGHAFALILITGLLICFVVAVNLLLVQRHGLPASGTNSTHQSWWSRWVFISAAVLYSVLVIIIPRFVPHTGALHNYLWYHAGIFGRAYAMVATLTMVLKGLVLIPCTISVAAGAIGCWRSGERNSSRRWLMLTMGMLLIISITRTESHAYSYWFMD